VASSTTHSWFPVVVRLPEMDCGQDAESQVAETLGNLPRSSIGRCLRDSG